MSQYFKYIVFGYLIISITILSRLFTGENYNDYLAHSFLSGSLHFIEIPRATEDLSFFNKQVFWPLGPFPAIIMMPTLLLTKFPLTENDMKILLSSLNFYLIYRIGIKLNLTKYKSVLLSIFFIFGSVYTGLIFIPISVYYTQVVAATCLLLAINELLNKKRVYVTGLFLCFAGLSRPTLFTAFLFSLLLIPQLKNRLMLVIILLIGISITATYNYKRFGKISEFGYSYQQIPLELIQRRDAWGAFSPKHIPGNLIHMLAQSPDLVTEENLHLIKFPFLKPNYYGMSILITSPILLLLVKTRLEDKYVKKAILTSFLILIPITLYYSYGWRQTGYRYSLDFMPFLLIPLVSALKTTKIYTIEILVILGILTTWFFSIEHLLDILA